MEQKGIRYIYNIFFAELWGAIFRGVMINFSFWLRRQLVDKKCHFGHCNILYHFMIHHGLQKRANFFSFKCCFRDKWSLINNGSKSLLNQLLIWLCICKFRRLPYYGNLCVLKISIDEPSLEEIWSLWSKCSYIPSRLTYWKKKEKWFCTLYIGLMKWYHENMKNNLKSMDWSLLISKNWLKIKVAPIQLPLGPNSQSCLW